MAFTSGVQHGGSDAGHAVEILAGGAVRNLRLYDRPGNDMMSHKGDLWKFNFTEFRFVDRCISIHEIQAVSIIESGLDGWHIDSIVTLVKDSGGGIQTLTQNLDANHWISGNYHAHRRFQLTLA